MIEIAKVRVTGANVRCNGSKIPRGMAGAYISVQYDSVWDNLVKTVVFKGSSTIDVVTNKNIIEVPHEVLQSVGKRVYIGFYGTAATGKVIIPTFWAELGTVVESTDPSGDESTDPALPVYAALTEQVGDLEAEQVNIKTAAESAMKAATEADKKAGNAKAQADNAIRNINTLREVVSKFHSNIVEKASGETIILDDASDMELAGLKVLGKTTQNGTPTPDAPVPLDSVGDDGSVAVTVCGKNLVDVFNENMSVMRDGKLAASYPNIVNEDGSLTINISGSLSYGQGFVKKLFAGQTVTISYFIDSIGNGSAIRLRIFDTNNYSSPKVSKDTTSTGKVTHTFTADADSVYMFGWFVLSGTVPSGGKIHDLQLEFGDTATEYEPYKNGGSVTITSPNGLPGIPVTSGGNYTDESGQQWVCDEVDSEKGVYVQKVQKITLTGETAVYRETMNGINRFYKKIADSDPSFPILCNYFPYGRGTDNAIRLTIDYYAVMYFPKNVTVPTEPEFANMRKENPMDIIYVLAEPIETALSAEQLAAFTALRTNYPNTTVFNDEGADMEVKYVADTKLYIDKKFDQLAAAMLNN